MTPEEFAIARRKLGWNDDKLAAELSVSPKAVRAWTEGTLRVPKADAKRIAWLAALTERDAALEAAGLPQCEWVKSWDAEDLPKKDKDLEAHFKRLDDHADQCPTCQARERFVKERFGPLPEMPASGLVTVFQWWNRFLQRFPEWAHPVFNGAAIVTTLTAFRAVPALLTGKSLLAALALPAGAAFGAIGGVAYSALRPYIKQGGSRKSVAHILVLLTYVTAGFAVVDLGMRVNAGLPIVGSIGLWSFIAVAVIVTALWRRANKSRDT